MDDIFEDLIEKDRRGEDVSEIKAIVAEQVEKMRPLIKAKEKDDKAQ